mmetsp:Transcript_35594/g.57185  ORF Transcript_35594/g.57185 Transcript_35594/m.57185 type:complete len:237 (-) Transcript_35594:873-1583(-)
MISRVKSENQVDNFRRKHQLCEMLSPNEATIAISTTTVHSINIEGEYGCYKRDAYPEASSPDRNTFTRKHRVLKARTAHIDDVGTRSFDCDWSRFCFVTLLRHIRHVDRASHRSCSFCVIAASCTRVGRKNHVRTARTTRKRSLLPGREPHPRERARGLLGALGGLGGGSSPGRVDRDAVRVPVHLLRGIVGERGHSLPDVLRETRAQSGERVFVEVGAGGRVFVRAERRGEHGDL